MRRILLPAIVLFFITVNAFSQAPVVQSVSATNGSYKAGQTINITLTFDIPVDVVASPNGISLALNTTPARFATTTTNSGAPATTLVLSYQVQANDVHNLTELNYIATNSLTLGAGSSIKKNGGGANDANLALPAIADAQSLGGTSNVLVDGVVPSGYSVAIDQSVINDANKAGVSFTFAGAEVGATYNYSIDDTNAGTAAVVGTGTVAAANSQITGINTTSLDDGTLTLTVYLTDVAGNQGADVTDTKSKDTGVPSAAATYSQNVIKNGVAQGITLTFNEPLTGTPKITVTGSVSGAIHTNQDMSMTSTSIWTFNAGTVWAGDETVTITVSTATDAAGNPVGTITSNTFVVDNTKPTSAATYTKNILNNGSAQTITVTFAENVTGATISLAGSTTGVITTNQPMTGGPTVWTYNAGSAWAGDETVTVTVGGTDAAGNTAEVNPATNTFIVDNTAPTSTATFTRNYIKTGTAQTVTVTFLENITTTPNITITAPSGTVATNQPMTGGPLVWTYAAGSTWTGNGTATVTLSNGTDAAGNAIVTTPATNTFIVDNQAPTAVTINQAVSQSDPAYSSTVDFTVVFTNGPIDPATFTGSDFTVSGGTADYTMGTPTTADNITWNVTATVTIASTIEGTIIPTLNLNTVSDLAGNTSGSIASSSTDNTVEAITEPTTNPTSISASAVTPNTLTITRTGGNGERYILVGKEGSPVDLVPTDAVNYSENSDFSVSPDVFNGNKVLGDVDNSVTTMNVSGLTGGLTYHFAVYAYNRGTVSTYNNFKTTGTSTSQTTAACVYPNAPTTLTTGSNTSTVTLNWARSTGSDFTLVLMKVDDGTAITAPTNGFSYASLDNTNFGTAGTLGNAKVILADETHSSNLSQSVTATALSAGVTYAFAIYTYNPTTLCYQPTNLTGTKATTTSTNPELTVTAGAGLEPNSISSLGTALTGAVGPQTNAVQNFDFTVTDGGVDGANGLITQIIINQGPNNQITNWADAISAVQLSDGSNTQTSNITVNATNIVISSISTGPGSLGRVGDNASKTYTLTIALRQNLLNGLGATIDNKQFDFNVNTASFTVTGSGSLLAAAQSVSSGAAKNVVTATATKIVVTTSPSVTAVANVALASQPTFTAQDPNNNTDLDFNHALTVGTTNPTNLGPTSAPTNFVNGVANFTASGFRFLNVGSSTMNVTANSITSANTGLITVTSATTLGSAVVNLAVNPIPANADDQGVFGFSLVTNGSSHNLTSLTITTSTDPSEVMSSFRLYSNSTDNFATATDLGLAAPTVNATSIAWSGLSVPISSTTKYFYLVGDVNPSFTSVAPAIQFQLLTTNFAVSLSGSTQNGVSQFRNVTFQDVTPPQVASITVPTLANPALNGIGSSNGTTTQTTNLIYTVTFDEPVFGLNINNFDLVSLDNVGNGNYPGASASINSVSGVSGSTTYTVTTNIPSGTGRLRLDFDPFGNSVQDNVGNQAIQPFNTGETYSVVLPEPNNTSGFFASAFSTSEIQVWWNSFAGVVNSRPTHVLILARGPAAGTEIVPSFPVINDGTPISDDLDFSDGLGAIKIPLPSPGAGSFYNFAGLRSGRSYQFVLYPYNLSPNNINYPDNSNFRTVGNLSASSTTLTASLGTIEPGSTAATATIQSTQLAYGAKNFTFKIKDDGATPLADDAKLQFTQLTISAGAANTVTDWSAVIDEAELVDITDNNTITTAANAIIGTNSITFQNLSTAANAIGTIDDDETKEYELRIRLKNPIGSAAQLTVDNQRFDFAVLESSFSSFYVVGSSKLLGGESESSGSANLVDVDADRLIFSTQPPLNALVLAPLSQTPEVRAVDVYGNVDRDYNTTLGIANAGTLGMSQNTIGGVNGRYIFPATFTYQDDGTGAANNGDLTLTGSGLAFSNVVSSGNVSVSYTNTTTITAGGILENRIFATSNSFNILAAPSTSPPDFPFAFDFLVNDDNTVSVGTDGAPTKITQVVITAGTGNEIDWSQALTQALLYNGTFTWATGASITANTITFTLDPNTSGLVGDNASRSFQLYIWLKPSMGTLPATIDNKNFVFEILQSNIQTVEPSSIIPASENENSGATNNPVQVVATRLNWITSPAPDLLVNKDINLQLPKPVIEAVDVYGNRDLDYVSAVTISNTNVDVFSNPDPIQMSVLGQLNLTSVNIPADGAGPSNGGIYTFPDNFQFDEISNGLIQLSAVSSGTSTVYSDASGFEVRVAKSITIKPGGDAEPALFSSLTTSSPGAQVFDFLVTDDDGGEDDGNPTQLTGMYIIAGIGDQLSAFDWSNAIQGVTLSDGTNTISANLPVQSSYFYFDMSSGVGALLGSIPDNGNKTYKLRIWLKSSLGGTLPADIDGKRFQFEVVAGNVFTSASSSAVVPGEVENSGVSNEVEVIATALVYANPTTATSASIDANYTPGGSPVQLVARDARGNKDKDFVGVIRSVTNATGASMQDNGVAINTGGSAITFGTTPFVAGVFTFPTTFRFTTGSNGDNVALTVTAGANVPCDGVTNICGTTLPITLKTSFESSFVLNPTFPQITATTRIAYLNYYQPGNTALTTANSYELMRALLIDGSRTAFPYTFTDPNTAAQINASLTTGTDEIGDGVVNGDADGAATRLTGLTLRITNPSNISNIQLFSTAGPIAGTFIDVTAIGAITATTASHDFVFTGAPILTAADDQLESLSVRVTFRNTSPELTDKENINIQLISATLGTGSQYFSTPVINQSFGSIDVVATSLDFVQQGSAYAGTDEPVGPSYNDPLLPETQAAIVHARDKYAQLDLDFNYTPTLTGGNPQTSATFVAGILNLDGMIYRNPGPGKLIVQANTLNSNTIPPDNINTYIPATDVEVVHVGTTIAAITTPPNLKGGTQGAVLLGVTFTPQHATTAHPSLKKFIFSFKDNPYQTGLPGALKPILKNFKVRIGSLDVTTTGATVTTGSSTNDDKLDLVIVDWGSGSLALFDGAGAPASKTFYLIADVDISAKIGTPKMTPQLIDLGYGDPTDASIITTNGTARSNIVGQGFTFASTRPPVLLTHSGSLTAPYNGQLNVDKAITQIKLNFDVPVWSLDGAAQLRDRNTNEIVADLTAVNGNVATGGFSTPAVNPLTFNINFRPGKSFQDDGLYYVTIKKGNYENLTQEGEGISDDGLNYFGGISSNSILFFKISSPNPPVLSNTNVLFSNEKTVVFQTTFDQRGTAYYMIVPAGSPKPTNDNIINNLGTIFAPIPAYPGTVIHRGQYPINLVNTLQSVTASLSSTSLAVNSGYDIWIFAKNDANPTNIATSAPYSGRTPDNYQVVAGGSPTINYTTGAAFANSYKPSYSICPDSYFTLTEPIIIGESTIGGFNQGALDQDFNLLLPPGFEFDGLTKPDVQLIGTDFVGAATVTWKNNTIVNIKYKNSTSSSTDKIVISNLRVRGLSGSATSTIDRFAGNAAIGSAIALADIQLFELGDQTFTNTFTIDNDFTPFGFDLDDVITAIPDNYIDKDPSLAGGIRLIPLIQPANDYGITSFSGNGVTNDVLTLSAVALNTAFDITMTHTDLNGCISTDAVQYVVYDNRAPISTKLGLAPIPDGPPNVPGGRQQGLVNANFPSDATTVIFPNTNFTVHPRINYEDKAGYKLLQMRADLGTSTVMTGPTWASQIAKIPKVVREITALEDADLHPDFPSYKEYQWDYNHILNAVSETATPDPLNPLPPITENPYDAFDRTETIEGTTITYWRGGSLGKIVFTGTFQSTADLQVVVPFRQEVELFVPPIPVVVAGKANRPIDTAPTYCEYGGGIAISGYPLAPSANESGTFAIFDDATNTPLTVPAGSFVDNGNGTATIYPRHPISGGVGVLNDYKPIRIVYTYRENNSPVEGSGYTVIRITPNPVALFSTTTPRCEDTDVQFRDDSPAISATGISITQWEWNFGDVNSASNESNDQNPIHVYESTGLYPGVSLNVTTNVGCKSTSPASENLQIGGTPVVNFDFSRVSVTDDIRFKSVSTVSSNDSFKQLVWRFGDGTVTTTSSATAGFNPAAPAFHKYSTAGINTVRLTVTSTIGCKDSLEKKVIILPRVVKDITNPNSFEYAQGFETGTGDWQTAPYDGFAQTSWQRGSFTKNFMRPTAANGQFFWATNNSTGSIEKGETSALYSPSFDISTLSRPMVSFDAFVDLDKSDGVIIEYSVDTLNAADPNKKWFVLGNNIGEGVDWFNERNLSGSPGNQANFNFGWSRQADATSQWLHSKHSLNNLGNDLDGNPKPAIYQATQIVFRFALGSNTPITPITEGFAIDNFRIGERTRIVLLENFTNLTNETINGTGFVEDVENKFITDNFLSVPNNAVVKLDYHVAFPKPDPLNLDNEQDPGARALYYNIATTPRVRMDGEINGNSQLFSTWGIQEYSVRSLKLADAIITLSGNPIDAEGNLNLSINIDANVDLPAKTILNVVLVEKEILKSSLPSDMQSIVRVADTRYTYVVKKLLPNAAGTKFGTDLLTNDVPRTFGPFAWPDDLRPYGAEKDLAVVVFLQNETTKEIYQTEIFDLSENPPLLTGTEDLSEGFNVYPNPADQELTIELPANFTDGANVRMFDQVGKTVIQSRFEKGERAKTLNTATHAAGVYLLQVESSKGILTRKVMVLHNR